MSPQMQEFFELLVAAEAAHLDGRALALDILMAEIHDAYEGLPRKDREWLDRHSESIG
jgi:hypothetical protein